jgi:hypothetical protein
LVLVDLHPQLQPLADVHQTAGLLHVHALAQLAQIALYEPFELLPLERQLSLQDADLVDGLQLFLEQPVVQLLD